MRKLSWALAVVIANVGFSGWAQQNKPFKVKSTTSEKPPKSAPLAKLAAPTAASSNAKDLQMIERQTAKSSVAPSPERKPATVSSVKPVEDKPNPPINFGAKSAGTTTVANKQTGQTGLINQGSNPLAGRLKGKGTQP